MVVVGRGFAEGSVEVVGGLADQVRGFAGQLFGSLVGEIVVA